MKQLLVDYHFHPNLSKNDGRAVRKCHKIWEQFAKHQLDVVMVTEHVFKNPPRAFRLMQETRPAKARTVIFPGIEALTKEGADIIVFSKSTALYEHPQLMVPKQLSAFKMVEYLNAHPELFGSIAHPLAPGHSAMASRLGEIKAMETIKRLKGVEVSNACFRGSARMFDAIGLQHILRQTRANMDTTTYLPAERYEPFNVTLYTGGSDAHVTAEIGSGIYIPLPDVAENVTADTQLTAEELFSIASTNRSTEFHITDEPILFWAGLYKIYSVIVEALTKAFRLYEGKLYQADDRFSNLYSEAEKEMVLAIRKRRRHILKPLLNALTYFRITPNVLNIINIISIIGSFTVVNIWPIMATVWFICTMGLAGITDSLAGYQKTQSEAGAITKIALHYVSILVAVLATLWFEWADPFWSALYLALYAAMLVLLVILNHTGQPIRLVIRSRLFIIAVMFLYALTTINIINVTLIGFSFYMVITVLWMLFRLRKATQ